MQYLLLSSHCSWLGSKQDDALTQLSQLVGPGKEFIPSEVPTLQTITQRGILIRDRMLLEQGSAKTDVHIKDIVLELVFSDSGTTQCVSPLYGFRSCHFVKTNTCIWSIGLRKVLIQRQPFLIQPFLVLTNFVTKLPT